MMTQADKTTQAENTESDAVRFDERTRALKERIYAAFTGLSVLAAIAVTGHSTAPEAFFALAVAILGISAAGFIAEVVAFQISHRRLPGGANLRVMARIAFGALTSASAPLLVLAVAWAGVMELEWALWFGIALYAVTLVVVLVIAGVRSGLPLRQGLVSSAMLIGLGALVILALLAAHAL